MLNFLVQIVVSIFIGVCFVVLASRYQKNKPIYFCIGFFSALVTRFMYLTIYGFFTNFKQTNGLEYHRNLSILFSFVIAYILFTIIQRRLKKKHNAEVDINEIGKK